jgi:hypothetical protein
MKGLFEDLRAINQLGAKTGPKDEALKNLSEKWKISPEVQAEVLPLMNQLKTRYWEDSERVLIAKIKGIILQDFMKKPATGFNDVAKEELADNNIFTTNDDGEIECPFVSKDAFMKAVNGLEGMKKKFDVRKKGQITIVDYTRPSNERRLFVIDLATNKVLHNTWVAHGFGTKMVDGKLENISAVTMADGFEYDEDDFIDVKKRILKPGAKKLPKFSNENSSNSSSEGFVLATQASHGTQFGDNVLLFGADKNNSRLSSRGVVMHTWGAPFDSYNLGVTEYIDDSDKTRSVDAIDLLKKADFKNGSMRDMEGPLNKLGNALATSPSLGKTYGCLGVTEMNVKQLDRKGRDKSQLQVLREDLPGSVIFNYSGPEQESKYYK